MKKRYKIQCLEFIVVLLMVFFGITNNIRVVHAGTYGNFEYLLINDGTEIEITGYNGSDTKLEIPSEIDGKKVTNIGSSAFQGCSGLTGDLVIPESVTSIGAWAFKGCSGFTGNLVIPEGVTSIERFTFSGCSGFTGNLVIPEGVTSIESSVFYGCSGLTGNLVIPEGVTSIGGWAFRDCSGFTGNLVIPKGVTSIGLVAFGGCNSLKKITVEDDNTKYKDIDGVLYNKAGTELLCVPAGKIGEFVIPEGVTRIVYRAFYGCSGLTGELVIPEGVTGIEMDTFLGCSSLASVNIPSSVTDITLFFTSCDGWYTPFASCSSLTKILVKEGNTEYTSIDGVLYNKAGTKLLCVPAGKTGQFVIPSGVETVGTVAFWDCNSLTSIEIPPTVTEIECETYFPKTEEFLLIVSSGSYAETYAKENNIPYTYSGEKWTVTIKNSSGQIVKTLRVNKGGILSAPQPSEERTNETFLGFYNGDTKFDFSKPITGDITLTEKWEEKKDNPENPVTPPQESGITLSKEALSFDTIGVTQTLTATVTPDTADKKVTWTSSDEKVAIVTDGVVTSVGNGMAVITVKSADGKTAAATVTVSQKTTKLSIQLNGQSVSGTLKAKVKKSYRFKAVVTPSNADTKNAAVTWTSSNKKIATVTSKGKVTIKKAGKVTITAKTADGRKAAIKLNATKKAVKVTKLKITGSKTMKVKAKQTLVLKLSPATADNQKVTWKSSNKKIATVNSKGVVTAKKAGKVTITAIAKDGSRKKATIKITVKK